MARESFLTGGIDTGTRFVKVALLDHVAGRARVVAATITTVPGRCEARDARLAIREGWMQALGDAGLSAAEIAHLASTGTRARAEQHVGHYYRGLAVELGTSYIFPNATALLDIGALQMRCRLLGVSLHGRRLATTPIDPSRGDEVYDELAVRALRLLRRVSVGGAIALVGGMALEARFLRAIWSGLEDDPFRTSLLACREGVFAGAYGAALLAARRYGRSRGLRPFVKPAAVQRHHLN